METVTDAELIEELASRHDELIVIRPDRKDDNSTIVFCKTKIVDQSYDLYEALELLHGASMGIMRDCLTETEGN